LARPFGTSFYQLIIAFKTRHIITGDSFTTHTLLLPVNTVMRQAGHIAGSVRRRFNGVGCAALLWRGRGRFPHGCGGGRCGSRETRGVDVVSPEHGRLRPVRYRRTPYAKIQVFKVDVAISQLSLAHLGCSLSSCIYVC